MRRDDDGATRRSLVVDCLSDGLLGCEVETCDRFVEQQNVSVLSQALSDEDTLSLSARHVREVPVRQSSDTQALHHLVHDSTVGSTRTAQTSASAGELDDLARGHEQMFRRMLRLQNVGHASVTRS